MSNFVSAVLSILASGVNGARKNALNIYAIAIARGDVPYVVTPPKGQPTEYVFGSEPSVHLAGSVKSAKDFIARKNTTPELPCTPNEVILGDASELPALLAKIQKMKPEDKTEKKSKTEKTEKKTVDLLSSGKAKKAAKKAKLKK